MPSNVKLDYYAFLNQLSLYQTQIERMVNDFKKGQGRSVTPVDLDVYNHVLRMNTSIFFESRFQTLNFDSFSYQNAKGYYSRGDPQAIGKGPLKGQYAKNPECRESHFTRLDAISNAKLFWSPT